MVVMGFMIYSNNRQMFVTQMRLKHAHSVTAELKQDAESKRRDKNVIARLVDAKDESHKSDIECN